MLFRKIPLTNKRLRRTRPFIQKKFSVNDRKYHFFLSNFKHFTKKKYLGKYHIYKNFINGTKFYKILCKLRHYIRRVYGEMKHKQMSVWIKKTMRRSDKSRIRLPRLFFNLETKISSIGFNSWLFPKLKYWKQLILHKKAISIFQRIPHYNYRTNLLDTCVFPDNYRSNLLLNTFFFKNLKKKIRFQKIKLSGINYFYLMRNLYLDPAYIKKPYIIRYQTFRSYKNLLLQKSLGYERKRFDTIILKKRFLKNFLNLCIKME